MSNGSGDESSDNDLDELCEFITHFARGTVPEDQPPAQDQGNVSSENRNNDDGLNELREYFRTISASDTEDQPSTLFSQNVNSVLSRSVTPRSFDPVIQRPLRGQRNLSFESRDVEEGLEELREYYRNFSANSTPRSSENARSESGDSDPPRFFPVSPPSTESSAESLDENALSSLFSNLAIFAQQTANDMNTDYVFQVSPEIISNLADENVAPINTLPQTVWIEATAGSQHPTVAWIMPQGQRPQRPQTVSTIAIFFIIILLIISRHRYPYLI